MYIYKKLKIAIWRIFSWIVTSSNCIHFFSQKICLTATQFPILTIAYILTLYKAWISGRDGRIHAQNLEIPSKRKTRTGYSRSEEFWVFQKYLLTYNGISRFQKIRQFSFNVEQFHSNFLLSIEGDFFDFTRNWMQFNPKILNLVTEYRVLYGFSLK